LPHGDDEHHDQPSPYRGLPPGLVTGFSGNVPATRLYAQVGFHQVGEHTSGELILEVILSPSP
jgi:hypothetical protein